MVRLMTVRPGRFWDPWREMSRLRTEMDRLLGGIPHDEPEFPPINIRRLPDRMVVEALIPGAERSTLEVTAVGNTLTLRGERRCEAGVQPDAYHRRERETGRFVRTIRVDERVTTDGVSANYRDGILRVELPYAPEAKPKKITVAG